MHICIISSQYLGFGKVGGFGSMTRKLAVALAGAGHRVTVVVPRRKGQERFTERDGIRIIGLGLRQLLRGRVYHEVNADLYHSQNPNAMTWVAMRAQPQKPHVITCRDPRDLRDWVIELRHATWRRRLKTPLVLAFEAGPLVTAAVRRADVVGCPAHFLRDKVARMYSLKRRPILLPNLETIPEELAPKADLPTVCMVGRLDRRKRPERCLRLAGAFPNVRFEIVGKAEDPRWQRKLESMAAQFPNVVMRGYVDKFASDGLCQIYGRSWVLLNTAAREGLPITFVEAAARGCAILSKVNPDDFAARFGFHAAADNFEEGLRWLLEGDRWRDRGRAAYEYVKETYDEAKALEAHLAVYRNLLAS